VKEFPFELTNDEKLHMLFTYFKIKPIKIDDEDKPMIIMALSKDDVAAVYIDDEEGLVIEYNDEEQQ
jgi:hypothetical protein